MTMAEPFFIKNREKLFSNLKDNSVAVLFAGKAPVKRGDEYYPFSPDRNFYYVSGIDRENCILLFTKRAEQKNVTLYIPRDNGIMAKWVGANMTPQEAMEISAIEQIGYNVNVDILNAAFPILLRFFGNFIFVIDVPTKHSAFKDSKF